MSTAVRDALRGTLVADSTLTGLLGGSFVYHEVAPTQHNGNLPYVIFNKQAGTPTYALSKTKAFDEEVWTVKAVERNETSSRVDAISTRIDQLLTDQTLTISGTAAMGIWREMDVEYAEVRDDQQYRHSGAMFRLFHS